MIVILFYLDLSKSKLRFACQIFSAGNVNTEYYGEIRKHAGLFDDYNTLILVSISDLYLFKILQVNML